MAVATIEYRGVEYMVIGHLSPRWADQGGDGVIVSRADGRPIRGSRMEPGMVQTGISATLTRIAETAIRRAMQEDGR